MCLCKDIPGAAASASCGRRFGDPPGGNKPRGAHDEEVTLTILWIVIVVLAIIGVLALLGRGRWGRTRRY
jgi:hypothetical protein